MIHKLQCTFSADHCVFGYSIKASMYKKENSNYLSQQTITFMWVHPLYCSYLDPARIFLAAVLRCPQLSPGFPCTAVRKPQSAILSSLLNFSCISAIGATLSLLASLFYLRLIEYFIRNQCT